MSRLSAVFLVGAAVAMLAGCKNPMGSAADAGPAVVDAAPPPLAILDAAPPDDTAASFDAGAVAPLTTKLPTTPTASPIPFASGESWNGSYQCGEARTLKLQITSVAGNTVNAIFDFHTRQGKSGAFHVSGKYDHASRHLHMTPGAWVMQPPGIAEVDLDGIVSPDGRGYSGSVIGARCTSFTTRR